MRPYEISYRSTEPEPPRRPPVEEIVADDALRHYLNQARLLYGDDSEAGAQEASFYYENMDQLFRDVYIGSKARTIATELRNQDEFTASIIHEDVAQGKAAERKLIGATIFLSYDLACASMGYPIKLHLPKRFRQRSSALAVLDKPSAVFADRMQSATDGILHAINRNLLAADQQGDFPQKKTFSFLERASVAGYEAIRRDVLQEGLGYRIQESDAQIARSLRKQYKTTDLSQITRQQAKTKEVYFRIQRLHDLENATDHVFHEDIAFPFAALEEASDEEGARIKALRLEEIYPDPHAQNAFDAVVAYETMQEYLDGLSDRRRTILLACMGFVLPELPKGAPYLQKELAQIFEVSAARIYKIKEEALEQLRWDLAGVFQEELGWPSAYATPSSSFTGDRLRTGRSAARLSVLRSNDVPLAKESSNEGWLRHLEDIDALIAMTTTERLRRKTIPYSRIYRALKEKIMESADMLRVSDVEIRRTPYPRELYDELENYLGPYLVPEHIEDFWNNQAQALLQKRGSRRNLPVHPNRLGQLVSRLLLYCMGEGDSISLRIPENMQGKCGYLGAWACRGKVVILGDAGMYTAAYISGNATVVSHGRPGAFSGRGARGNSSFFRSYELPKEVQKLVVATEPSSTEEDIQKENRQLASEQKYATMQAPQTIDFRELAGYLGLSLERLTHYAQQIGHKGHDELTTEEVLELRKRWPDIGR